MLARVEAQHVVRERGDHLQKYIAYLTEKVPDVVDIVVEANNVSNGGSTLLCKVIKASESFTAQFDFSHSADGSVISHTMKTLDEEPPTPTSI